MSQIPLPRLVAPVAALLLLGSAALAAGDPPEAPDASKVPASSAASAPSPQPAPGAEEPKLICEQVQQMGSHFKRKVCATAEAWEARRRKDADQMSRMGDQGAGCGGVANPC